jgi:hypothetical protein
VRVVWGWRRSLLNAGLTLLLLLLLSAATGAATGQLLNTLHTPAMSYHGHKQMNRFTQVGCGAWTRDLMRATPCPPLTTTSAAGRVVCVSIHPFAVVGNLFSVHGLHLGVFSLRPRLQRLCQVPHIRPPGFELYMEL